MLVHITHQTYAESTDGLLRGVHAAAKTTRSATVLAALERAAQTYYTLYYEAKESAHAILHSEYGHDRRIRAYRKAIARCARRKRAMLADQDRQAGVWCDSRGKLHAQA